MLVTTHTHDSPDSYKSLLNDLIRETFGFSFAPWHRQNHWNADYTCYSILADGRMLANVSVYRMNLLVNRLERQVYQIGAVATRKERRGEGLSRLILQHIFDRSPRADFFLCANESVLDFYPKFGFRPLEDRQPFLNIAVDNPAPSVNRLAANQTQVIDGYLKGRRCFSRVLDCTNAAPIHWFHLLLAYPNSIYEIPALETMLVAEQEGSTLTLVEVWSKRPLAFAQLLPHLPFRGVGEVRFGFNPDWLGVDCQWTAGSDTHLFVRGAWDVSGDFILPMLLRT